MTARSVEGSLQKALWPLGLLYGLGMAVRNWTFDRGLRRVHRLPVPVVSVGNLTVGGTGKTPAVLWLCQLLRHRGRKPAVLARGYGRSPGAALNDEGLMLQRRLPWLLQEQDPDRVAGGARLVQRGADCIVLDDGYQHRRLHRDLDILCMDAARPFGTGAVLPAGDLREFRSGIRRASLVLLTRASDLDGTFLRTQVERLRELAGRTLPVHACEHAPQCLVQRPGGGELALGELATRPLVLLSAVARPDAFAATVRGLGGRVVRELRYRDHHRFTDAEAKAAADEAAKSGAALVTTEKDDARLPVDQVERWVLRVDLRFLGPEPALPGLTT